MKPNTIILILVALIGCGNRTTAHSDDRVAKLLEKQLQIGMYWDNDVTDVPNGYIYTKEDLDVSSKLICGTLSKKGFKSDSLLFRKRMKDLFGISLDTLPVQIRIDLHAVNYSLSADINVEMHESDLTPTLFLSPRDNIVLFPYYIPEIMDYRRIYPAIARSEDNVPKSIESEFGRVTVTKWSERAKELKERRKFITKKLFHANNYLVNNQDNSFDWLLAADPYFLYRLLTVFGYDKDERINKKILDDNTIDVPSKFISYRSDNKLRIYTGVLETVNNLSTERCSDYFQAASDFVDLVAYNPDTEEENLMKYPLLGKITLAERRKIVAYMVNTLQLLYAKYNGKEGYGHFDQYGVGIVDCFWNAMFNDRQMLWEIERNNCYNLPNLTELIHSLKQDERFVNPQTGALEPWGFSPESYAPDEE